MTTAPTQGERERALFDAALLADGRWSEAVDTPNVARVILALAAENKARVLKLRAAVNHLGCTSASLQERYYYAIGALKADQLALAADDAKAAGEPGLDLVAWFSDPTKAEQEVIHNEGRVPVTDDRASRRRAFVREHAPVILAAMFVDPTRADLGVPWNELRASAIEQAGLVFDETEQSE